MQRMTRVGIHELSGELAFGPQPRDARLAEVRRKRTEARVDFVGGLRGRHRLPGLERQSDGRSGRFRIHSRFMEGVPPDVNFCSAVASTPCTSFPRLPPRPTREIIIDGDQYGFGLPRGRA